METTIKKRIEIEGYGMLEAEFVQNDEGWLCREVDGIRWNFRDWGAQAAMETPEEAAFYLLSLNIDDSGSSS